MPFIDGDIVVGAALTADGLLLGLTVGDLLVDAAEGILLGDLLGAIDGLTLGMPVKSVRHVIMKPAPLKV